MTGRTEEKDVMVKVVVNLINQNNLITIHGTKGVSFGQKSDKSIQIEQISI